MPRRCVLIADSYYDTPQDDLGGLPSQVTDPIPVGGTITEVGFVNDRGDTGSVTYRNTKIGGRALNF